jgi:hypothetical protein
MKCFKEFMPFIKKRLYKPPTWKDEHGVTHYPKPLYEPDVKISTRRSDNLPLGVKPNES